MARKRWVFTEKRKQSIVKARKEHSRLVSIGKRVRDSRGR